MNEMNVYINFSVDLDWGSDVVLASPDEKVFGGKYWEYRFDIWSLNELKNKLANIFKQFKFIPAYEDQPSKVELANEMNKILESFYGKMFMKIKKRLEKGIEREGVGVFMFSRGGNNEMELVIIAGNKEKVDDAIEFYHRLKMIP